MAGRSEADLKVAAEQLALFVALVDGEKASQAARSASIDGRAGVLVGASAVIGALKIGTSLDGVEFFLLALSFVSAAIGLYVTRPRKTWGYDLRAAETAILGSYDGRPLEAKLMVAEEKAWQIRMIEDDLEKRSKFVTAGYVVLALSVLASLLLSFVAVPPPTT